MLLRHRFAVVITVLAALMLLPLASAAAQEPDDMPSPIASDDGDGINEVVHSWALAPAGSDVDGAGGNRPLISLVADPGGVIEDAVTLANFGNVPLVFRIYAADVVVGDDGASTALGADAESADVGSWIDLGAEQIRVDAGSQATIPITIRVPDNAAPGDHSGVILAANAARSTGPDGQRFEVDRRTGTSVRVRVTGPLFPELAVADIRTDYKPALNPLGGSATVTYVVENRGNVRVGGSVSASIGGPFGIGRQEGIATEFAELAPGERVTFTEEFTGVPALVVVATDVEIIPNTGEVASVSRRTNTLAPPIAVLLLILAAVLGLLAARLSPTSATRRHNCASARST